MGELMALAGARVSMLRHAAYEFLTGSRLRAAVVLGLVIGFWCLMFAMFLDGFRFLSTYRALSDIVLDYLFAFFYLSLLVMMTISNGIIAYTSLYRSEETAFLLALPVHAENTFTYRASDSTIFSAWGMGTLVVPMILAYGLTFPTNALFYPMAIALALLFVVLSTELGAFFAVLAALVLPRRKRTILAVLVAAGAAAGVLWFLPLWEQHSEDLFSEAGIRSVIDRIAFCQHWALPSHWVSRGMLAAARGQTREAGFLLLMLASNVAFVGVATRRFGYHAFRRTWTTLQGAGSPGRRSAGRFVDPVLNALVRFLPLRLRLLVVKDMKTFLRDPSQWSQFLLFFGLLGLYVVNMPRFGLEDAAPLWHSLSANLNLAATCLTLATLTSRFVFPQLSLEGRRIWLTGLLPMRRTTILWGKFFFAAVGTFVISGGLVAVSDASLGLPAWTLAVHVAAVACICCGLNGLAVGLGALYPRLGTDNPSKIVSSFGGTLNLMCSICFLAFALAPIVVPLHLHAVGALDGGRFTFWMAMALAVVIVISAIACLVPMLAGARAFRRMEF
jgi:ABC-2 type transport system permease protein